MVAAEHGWSDDWLNNGAKGYLIGLSSGPVVLSAPGIEVRSPSTAQLLAMKLSAWRDDIDRAHASRLLEEMKADRNEIWPASRALSDSRQRAQSAVRFCGLVGGITW
jgi:hypothetical protein